MEIMSEAQRKWSKRHLGVVCHDFDIEASSFESDPPGYLTHTRLGRLLVDDGEKQRIENMAGDFHQTLRQADAEDMPDHLLELLSLFCRAKCNQSFMAQFAAPQYQLFQYSGYIDFAYMYVMVKFFETRVPQLGQYLFKHQGEGLEPKTIRPSINIQLALEMMTKIQTNHPDVAAWQAASQNIIFMQCVDINHRRPMVLLDDGLRRKGRQLIKFQNQMWAWGVNNVSALQYIYSITNEVFKFFEVVQRSQIGDYQPDIDTTGFTSYWHDEDMVESTIQKFKLYAHICRITSLSGEVYDLTNKMEEHELKKKMVDVPKKPKKKWYRRI